LQYLEDGKLPENKLLLALLTGNYRYCVEEIDPDLAAILTFLTRHCPPFAYGSMENAVKWEFVRKNMRAAARKVARISRRKAIRCSTRLGDITAA
jgi:hypothetical protein